MAENNPQFLHCRIRVRDMERSVRFYTDVLGFKKKGDMASPVGNVLVYMELPGNNTVIELCYQPGAPEFSFPEDIFHMAFSTTDLQEFRNRWEPEGIKFWPDEGPLAGKIYFINDPDGYEIELLKV